MKLFHLYFATFLVGNIIFSAIFCAGPPEKLKSKKKPFRSPPPYEFLDTPLGCSQKCYENRGYNGANIRIEQY